MRNANTILGIIHDRGTRGLPLERVYRLLFNRDLFLLAYGRISRNAGAMAPGSTPETADGMCLAKIDAIIEALRFERYRWTPVRRIYIKKARSTKNRPLGLPTWSDKLVQEVIRLILEAYYEPRFSTHSHGFRPHRGCHTALSEIYHTWKGTTWFIEGDIAQCFDSLEHSLLLTRLSQNFHDQRFVRLISDLLKAGYLEDWKYHKTLSGSPQGSVVSPILANLYLDQLDTYVETTLLPMFNYGRRRKRNAQYKRLSDRAQQLARQGRSKAAAAVRRHYRSLPSTDPNDPDYRRLRYVRYADDFLLGFCGPRSEAETIKQQLGDFLQTRLNLKLSETKTLITHARTDAARFLGYGIHVLHGNHVRNEDGRRTNGTPSLRVPADVVTSKCHPYLKHGKPIHRMELTNNTVFSIVAQYQQEYRGIVDYYCLAFNRSTQLSRLKFVMEQSLTKTLAVKLRLSVPQVYKRYQTILQTPEGPRKGLQVELERAGKQSLIAQWGGISLKRRVRAVLNDAPKPVWNVRTELSQRLLAARCELCGIETNCEVHHIRKLKDLHRPGRAKLPDWAQVMVARHRKTLIVCRRCHDKIHSGRATGSRTVKIEHWKAGCS
jgi:group II intron reverse transcriptase/maturase